MTSARAADRLNSATPDSRDRYVDLLRAVSIGVVVFGHWTMAAFSTTPDGGLRVENVLSYASPLQPLTWVAQVMPLFFIAAGFTNALSLRTAGRTGARGIGVYLSGRVERVTRPALVFILVWLAGSPLLVLAGAPEALVRVAGQNSAMVLWFLAVYLLLAALAPLQWRLYRRAPWLLPILAPASAAALDQLQNTAWAGVGFLNYLLVFAFCQHLGFWYADGKLRRISRIGWAGIGAGAVGSLVLLTGPGPYPVSMIGLPGQPMSNMLPPSVCVIAVAVLQLSLAMALRPALTPWLHRPRVWLGVVLVNRSVMTIFLWHLTAITVVTGVAILTGIPFADPGTGTWWWHKLLWLVAATLLTAAIAVGLTPIENRSPTASPDRRTPAGWSAVGTVVVAFGMAMLAAGGFADPFDRGGIALAGLTFAPWWGAAAVLAGYLLCRVRGTALRR